MSLYRTTLRRGLLDFHIGEAVPEIAFDVPRYMREMAEAGMQTLTFMTKDAFGTSYYDTRIGKKNAKLAGKDLLEEAVTEAHRNGIRLIAYYNVGLNSYVAGANPDYRQRDKDGAPVTNAFGFYDLLCLNSPYRDYVAAQLSEIAERYTVDGFFFDITYVWPSSCHCDYCRKWYVEKYGQTPPVSPPPGSADLRRWQQFQRDIRADFLRFITGRLKKLNPDLEIGWNHAGDLAFAHMEPDERADYLTSEFHPPIYLYGSLLAKWKRTKGKPFELMMPSEMGSWGEWTLAPAATLKAAAAITVSGGGSISFGHVPLPSGALKGALPSPVVEAIKEANDFIREREEWLLGASSVPDVAVLHGVHNRRMFESTSLPNHADDALNGINRMLIEGNVHFDVLSERDLVKQLGGYAVLAMPDQAYVSPEVEEAVREFVRGGGLLIATHRTSLYTEEGVRKANFGLADVFGVDFDDTSRYSVNYMADFDKDVFGSVPDMPVLVKGTNTPVLRVRPSAEARVLSVYMEPAMETKTHRHVYHQHAHPAIRTDDPAITLYSYGKGACLYLSAPVEASYWKTGSPWLRRIYMDGYKLLRPDPLIEVDAPIGVEVNLMRQASRWIVHLVQVREEKAAGSKTFMEEIWPLHNIKVRIRAKPARLYLAPQLEPLPFAEEGDGIVFTIPVLELHAMAVLEDVQG
ncbi:beta-galactosidase trimerization domain-containing protein [Paenibacillus sp. GCM10012303]|uniref:beta-galactosidase trimerization domain-containing protein n=1 Tax=Paenibacillus sp. GCM10012303 TaxID=3317340 RepID=UPI003618CAF3